MLLSGAKIIVECLLEQGVDTVFGFPGGQIIDTYDALYAYRGRIRHILTSHEQGAAHAADGYARVSGKVGVVIATSGPGATNLVTGLATAFMDSVPMVAITGNVSSGLLGKDSFQEVDIFGITMPITKHNFIVRRVEELADTMRRAFRIAASGRPGPVLVDVLKDVQQAQCEFEPRQPEPILPETEKITEADIDVAVRMIEESKRPVIFAGGGVIRAGASPELYRFAARLGAPVSLSLMGLGAYPAGKRQYMGMLGMHGTRTSATAVSQADLLIVCGARFSDRVIMNANTFAKQLRILHLDIDAAEINKNIISYASVCGDVKVSLAMLTERCGLHHHGEWLAQVADWKAHEPRPAHSGKLTPQALIDTVRAAVPDDTIIATDVGQHQMWVAQRYPFQYPRTLCTSGGLGTMGYGMGAAIGAQSAFPKRRVVLFTGDGSFHMNLNELATAVTYRLPIVIVVMNNGVLGMVRQWQKILYNGRYSETTLHRQTDYVRLAEAFGATGLVVSRRDELARLIPEAVNLGRTVVIDARISKDENVLPMVAPGRSYNDQILSIDKQGGIL
ncbi:MAG TPA: biosynthetic-type acetolactate synthase large subunit [Candidatus Avichristensenella intestinipullorum]|uniref:Acetolactate synthase n=1 Tax=Candidatus Avichristensenella intestinipullorum TaxID=2840693 RepID=A0A9D0YY13_9FIRM|nr:biosynthetic-type acetolactate synthase large subunit [Candidatus Avichristensenella intestinipullorum]